MNNRNIAAASTPAIAAAGLTKRYRDQVAVDDLSLTIRPGEIYGFLGLNGAGKTTTIRMLLGMARPSRGLVSIFGIRVSSRAVNPWPRVGYLVETPHAYPELTVRENLEIVRRLRRLPDPAAGTRVIERLGLKDDAGRRAGALSHGNAQRLGLAKALIHEPDLLILDEPANGLDPAGVVEVRELLKGLARDKNVTVFMSSHILAEVSRLATRIGIIHRGRLQEELDAADLERYSSRKLEVDARDREAARAALRSSGFAPGTGRDGVLELSEARALEHPEEIARLLVAAGVPPTRLALRQEDLESHFLALVGPERGEPCIPLPTPYGWRR